jgi:hypothetical protein
MGSRGYRTRMERVWIHLYTHGKYIYPTVMSRVGHGYRRIALYLWVYPYPTRLLLIFHVTRILLLTYELEYRIVITNYDNNHVLNCMLLN